MHSSLHEHFNFNVFVVIVTIYIILIFYMKQLKRKLKHESMIEILTFARYILILSPCFLFILFGIKLYFKLGSDFLSRGTHLLTIMFTYLIVTFIIALILKKGLKIMSRLSNKYLIVVPIINIIINLIYITNQYFDFFTELDLIGNYFKLLKLENENIVVSHFIFGYLMLENLIVLIYVLFVINIKDENILKFICSDKSNKLDKNCVSEIIKDIFTYTMFIKFIVCVIFMIVMQYIKKKHGGDNMTIENGNDITDANPANSNANDNAAANPNPANNNTANANPNPNPANAVATIINDANIPIPVDIPKTIKELKIPQIKYTPKGFGKKAKRFGKKAKKN